MFQGVRDDSYDKKTDTGVQRVPRFVADVYVVGMGALEIPVDDMAYRNLQAVQMGTAVLVPLVPEVRNNIITAASGRPYVRRELSVRIGALELAEQGKKAS